MANRAGDWLRQAEDDLGAARDLRVARRYSAACFMAQQSAEKALKALLEHHRLVVAGHNLNDLLARVPPPVAASQAITDACRRLNRLYIPTRYPDAHPSGAPADQFADPDAAAAITDAEEVLNFVRPLV
jgi:HEPN domain-containing protein